MQFDAVILAGGRSSRLGGEPKSALVLRGETLLQLALSAASRARSIVVVGDDPDGEFSAPAASARPVSPAPVVRFVREQPKYGGPAAAIAAGVSALATGTGVVAEFTLVLACDMPNVAAAVEPLSRAMSGAESSTDGVIARDQNGREQYLAAIHRTSALAEAVRAQSHSGGVDGISVRSLLSGLALLTVDVPPGSTDDIDTWADATNHGITRQLTQKPPE